MRRNFAVFIFLAGFAAGPALAQSGAAQLQNTQAANENAFITKAQAALDAKRWPDAEAVLKQLIAYAPRWNYFEALGNAQFNQGHYAQSIAYYQRAIDLGQKDAGPAAIRRMHTTIGNANLKLKKNDAAIATYNKAAAIDPHPATAYFNLCAVLYNMGQVTAKTIAACDKAIAADPKKADAYFIKGPPWSAMQPSAKTIKPLCRRARWKRSNSISCLRLTARTQRTSRSCSTS